MPEMGGFEVTAAIREREQATGTHIPIVAMTAHAMKGDQEKCLEAGMDDYVSKPINAEELYATIERMMDGTSAPTAPSIESEPHAAYQPAGGFEPSIDLSTIIDAVDGDRELLKELAEDFVEDGARQLEELRESLEHGDPGQIERRAHSLKGMVGNFGAQAAYELVYELENMGRASRLDGAFSVYQKLEQEMERLKRFFSEPGWEERL